MQWKTVTWQLKTHLGSFWRRTYIMLSRVFFFNIIGILLGVYMSHCLVHISIEEHVELFFHVRLQKLPRCVCNCHVTIAIALMHVVINTDSVCAVGALAAPFFAVFPYGRPSVQLWPLILPVYFYFRNINAQRASFFCRWFKLCACIGINTILSWSWRISFCTAFSPSYRNQFIPSLRCNCVNTWTIRVINPSSYLSLGQ